MNESLHQLLGHIYHINTTDNGLLTENVTEFANTTLVERPYWMNVLDKASTIIMTVNVVALMLGMGAATHLSEVWYNMKRPWGCLIGILCQFLLLPSFGYGTTLVLNLTAIQSIGVIILTCSPGGAFSNFFTYWVDGDIALSILMTSTSSLLAFGGMPFNLWLYASKWTAQNDHLIVPYINVFISMCFVTIPAVIGMIIRHYTRFWANRISTFCGILGWVGAGASAVFLTLVYWDKIETLSMELLIAAALVPAAGFTIAFILSKLLCQNNKISRTIGIETGCQNMAVAANVMLLSYPDPQIRGEMLLFPVTYGILQITEIILAIIIFQIYKFIHRNDVTEEEVKSVIDNTVLSHVSMMTKATPIKEGYVVPDVIADDFVEIKNNTSIIYAREESRPFIPYQHRSTTVDRDFPNVRTTTENQYCNPQRDKAPPRTVLNDTYSDPDSFKRHKVSGNFQRQLSYEDYTPRSPSLNSGYEFQTFGAFKRT